MKKLLFALLICCFSITLFSQEAEQENPYFKKNSLNLSLIDVNGMMTFNYERYWQQKFLGADEIGFKVGYCNLAVAAFNRYIDEHLGGFVFGYNHVFTKKRHGLALNLDVTPFQKDFTVGYGASWRYQAPKGFVMKLGMGIANVFDGSSPFYLPNITIGWSF